MLNVMRIPRLPPGQSWVLEPIVYDIGPVPPVRLGNYRLRLSGAVRNPIELDWPEIQALPRTRVRRDFHCVTTWSVRGILWEGISTRTLLSRVSVAPDARWVLARCRDGYSADVPIDAFAHRDSLLADRMNGSLLAFEHGAPLRLVVPSLYAWKSAKYVEELEFLSARRPGYWENRGYHDRGDPWREERFRAEPGSASGAGT